MSKKENTLIVMGLATLLVLMFFMGYYTKAADCSILEQQRDKQTDTHEKQIETIEKKYKDEILDLKQKLLAKTFEYDMATNHIELINAGH